MGKPFVRVSIAYTDWLPHGKYAKSPGMNGRHAVERRRRQIAKGMLKPNV